MKKSQMGYFVDNLRKTKTEYLIPANPKMYRAVIKCLISPFKKSEITKVVAIDMKGLMFGPTLAYLLNVGFTPFMKGGKMKKRHLVVKTRRFVDYSGKEKSFEILKEGISKGDRVLIVDDWFESGKTGRAAIKLIEARGGKVVGISVIFNKLKSSDEQFFARYDFHYIKFLERK